MLYVINLINLDIGLSLDSNSFIAVWVCIDSNPLIYFSDLD